MSSSSSSSPAKAGGRVVVMAEGAGRGGARGPSEEERLRRSAGGLEKLRRRLRPQREGLPISAARPQLVEALRANRNVVIVGETGSGKTTQIPQFMLEEGLAGGKVIAVTQPRRVAAVTVAQRVADERGARLGTEVGYTIRFDDCSGPRTRIKYLTDGMLMREASVDPELSKYGAVILDEAHERTLHTDILFAVIKQLQARRKDLRVVAMSATLQAERFSEYFFNAPSLYVSGRQHPVDLFYTAEPQADYVDAAVVAALQLHLDEPAPGDILVFLTGQEEIESVRGLLNDRAGRLPSDAPRMLVTPIYAALPPAEQLRVFEPAPPGSRKVILATNIAETSITISGVRYVVDSGFVKVRRYHAATSMECLEVAPVSKAEAGQRAGRAGRQQAGSCYRLYTEAGHATLDETVQPELLRCNLASAVLQMKAIGIRDVLRCDFMDRPPRAGVHKALELLYALGALGDSGDLSERGRAMSAFPLDPAYARVLLAAPGMGCSEEMLTVVAVLSADNVFFTPRGRRDDASAARRRFASNEGDHLTLLHVYRAYLEAGRDPKWCRENFISSRALQRAEKVRRQLAEILRRRGDPLVSSGADLEPVRRCLVAGLFLNAARLQPDGTYRTMVHNTEVHIHPSSVLMGVRPRPPCVLYNELVLTTKRYMRDVTVIDQRWLAELAPRVFASASATQSVRLSSSAVDRLSAPAGAAAAGPGSAIAAAAASAEARRAEERRQRKAEAKAKKTAAAAAAAAAAGDDSSDSEAPPSAEEVARAKAARKRARAEARAAAEAASRPAGWAAPDAALSRFGAPVSRDGDGKGKKKKKKKEKNKDKKHKKRKVDE